MHEIVLGPWKEGTPSKDGWYLIEKDSYPAFKAVFYFKNQWCDDVKYVKKYAPFIHQNKSPINGNIFITEYIRNTNANKYWMCMLSNPNQGLDWSGKPNINNIAQFDNINNAIEFARGHDWVPHIKYENLEWKIASSNLQLELARKIENYLCDQVVVKQNGNYYEIEMFDHYINYYTENKLEVNSRANIIRNKIMEAIQKAIQ